MRKTKKRRDDLKLLAVARRRWRTVDRRKAVTHAEMMKRYARGPA
jgi:hypothetical protein